MRLALLVPVLISIAAPAYAEGARESRYGPTTPRQASAAAAAARYDGPMLSWSNKRQASLAAAAPTTFAPTRPAPLANWANNQATPAPATYAPPPASTAPPPPTSLYAPPRAAPAARPAARPAAAPVPVMAPAMTAAPVKDWSSYRSARMTTTAPTPVTPPPPQPAPAPPRQVAAANTGGTGARYYSVGREYGLTPDALPPAGPDTRVLITAGEPPLEPKGATPAHGSADWLAAGVAGDDDQDDDSASRRAKSRNEAL